MDEARLAQVKKIVCEALELDAIEVTGDGHFMDSYGADSLQLIEVVAALEKEYSVVIRQEDIEHMMNLRGVCEVLERTPGW